MTIDSSQLQRLVPHWSPGVWVGAVRRVFGPINELVAGEAGVLVDSHPPHSLLVLWKPPGAQAPAQPPFLRRMPWMVSIRALADADAALAVLLAQMPHDARLYLARHDIDWALMAEIVMLTEKNLAPYHHRELQAFVQAERDATRAAISAGYRHDDDGRHFANTGRDELP
jgi:hypothetical protein